MESTKIEEKLYLECTPSELPGFPPGNEIHGIGKIVMDYAPLQSKLQSFGKVDLNSIAPEKLYAVVGNFVDRTESIIFQGENMAAKFNPIGNKLECGGVLEESEAFATCTSLFMDKCHEPGTPLSYLSKLRLRKFIKAAMVIRVAEPLEQIRQGMLYVTNSVFKHKCLDISSLKTKKDLERYVAYVPKFIKKRMLHNTFILGYVQKHNESTEDLTKQLILQTQAICKIANINLACMLSDPEHTYKPLVLADAAIQAYHRLGLCFCNQLFEYEGDCVVDY